VSCAPVGLREYCSERLTHNALPGAGRCALRGFSGGRGAYGAVCAGQRPSRPNLCLVVLHLYCDKSGFSSMRCNPCHRRILAA